MKKILPFAVAAVLFIVVVLMITGPIVGNVFSKVNGSLAGVSGGAQPLIAPAAPQMRLDTSAPEASSSEGFLDLLGTQNTSEVAYDQTAASNGEGAASPASMGRIVIQNADLSIVVSDVKGRMQNIQVMAQQMGGYVVSSNLYQSYTNDNVQVPEAQITIRVPAEKLDDALEQIKKDVVEVQNETRAGQDVTAEYVDLQSRLKNYEAAEAQLEKILENAADADAVANIFNQLVYYREQIELVKGQMKYYEEAAALSAINIRIVAEETIQPVVIGKWQPKGVAREAAQDLINFLKDFTELSIRFVIYILPSWLLVGIPLYLVFIGGCAIYRRFNKTSPSLERGKSIVQYIKNNNDEINKITDIGELEQKIREGETLLIQESNPMSGWIPLVVSIGIVIYMAVKIPRSEVYLILTGFGLVYLGFNVWRIYNADKQKKEIEATLGDYRDKKAELQEKTAEKK